MKATFMGYSSFVSKKSNNPVLLVSIAYESSGWNGFKVTSSWVDNDLLPDIKSYKIGSKINVDLDFNGHIIDIYPLDK